MTIKPLDSDHIGWICNCPESLSTVKTNGDLVHIPIRETCAACGRNVTEALGPSTSMPWVCDCQSARVHALASPGGFTAILPTDTCFWCGRTYDTANQDAADRMVQSA